MAGVRIAGLMAILGVLLVTAWICLLAGLVVLLAQILGPGVALLSAGGAILALCLLIVLIARLARTDAAANGPPDGLARLAVALAEAVLAGLSGRRNLRLVLIGLALLSTGIAVAFPARNDPRKD